MSQMASDTVCQYPHNGHLMRIKGSFYRQKLSIVIQNPEFSLLQNPFFFSFRQKVLTFLCASSQRKNDFKLKLKSPCFELQSNVVQIPLHVYTTSQFYAINTISHTLRHIFFAQEKKKNIWSFTFQSLVFYTEMLFKFTDFIKSNGSIRHTVNFRYRLRRQSQQNLFFSLSLFSGIVRYRGLLKLQGY